jgi:hypothetical protein
MDGKEDQHRIDGQHGYYYVGDSLFFDVEFEWGW